MAMNTPANTRLSIIVATATLSSVWVASLLVRALRKQRQLGDDSLEDEPAGPSPPPPVPPPPPPVPLSQMSPRWASRTQSESFDDSAEGHRNPATPAVATPSSGTNNNRGGGGGSCRRRSRVNSLEVDVGAIFGLDAGGSLAKLVYFEATDGPLGARACSESTTATEGRSELGGGAWGLIDAPLSDSPLGGSGGSEEASSPNHSNTAGGAASRLMRGLARPTLQRVRSLAALNRTPAAAREALHAFYDFMSKRLGPTYVSSTVCKLFAHALYVWCSLLFVFLAF